MKIPQFISLFLLFGSLAFTEIISPEWRIDWNPGIPGGYPEKNFQVNVRDFGAVGDGETDDSGAFIDAIKAIPGTGGVLFIPQGDYLVRKKISINKGVLLRGESFDRSRLFFDLDGRKENCIEFVKYERGAWTEASEGFTKGSTTLVVNTPEGFAAGDFIELQQENDADIMYTKPAWNQSWAQNAVGQICRIERVEDGVLVLHEPLNFTYNEELAPQVRKLGMILYPGVEDVYIERLDAGDGHTIQMRYTAYGLVQRIESNMTFRSHIYLSEAYGGEVRNNYLHHSHDYGGGGHGYGVDIVRHSVNVLVIDNVFKYLRHSMLTHVGTSGNVYAYNYSFDREPQRFCDISLHGHYSHFNLFESNVIEEIDIADYWGPMGPGNTFLRNVINQEGIDVKDYSHGQNLVGNVLQKGTVFIQPGVLKTLKHGNVVGGAMQWDENIDDRNIPTSYFLKEKPEFLQGFAWPLFGPDVAEGPILPAQYRWNKGNPITGVAATPVQRPQHFRLRVFPNPFNPRTTISFTLPQREYASVRVYSIDGRLAATLAQGQLDAGEYAVRFQPKAQTASGVFIVVVDTPTRTVFKKATFVK